MARLRSILIDDCMDLLNIQTHLELSYCFALPLQRYIVKGSTLLSLVQELEIYKCFSHWVIGDYLKMLN